MNKSIQYFLEKVIPQLEKIYEMFMKNPKELTKAVDEIHAAMLHLGTQFVAEMLEDCDDLLRESQIRKEKWTVKENSQKQLLTSIGTIYFRHTRFQKKNGKETSYLLDKMLGLKAHSRLSEDAKRMLLEEAVQTSYAKAGKEVSLHEPVSKECVMELIHELEIPNGPTVEQKEKRQVKYLYVEADEDHATLQFHKKKGDIKRYKNHADNGQIVKLVYVHEGKKPLGKGRMGLKNARYFAGVYGGRKENARLWKEVNAYIEQVYNTEKIEKIYLQADGGSWITKGISLLGAKFVLDEFHIGKYVRKMGYASEEEKEETTEKLLTWLKEGKKKEIEEWVEREVAQKDEKKGKKLKENWEYLKKNWSGVMARMSEEEGVLGSSTEGHVSHVLSSRLSSRPRGWSQHGVSQMAHLLAYKRNGGDLIVLLRKQAEEKEEKEVVFGFSSSEMISWERKHGKKMGKYVEALQGSVNLKGRARLWLDLSTL